MRTALIAALLGACTAEPTQLVVVLASDLRVPDEIDALSIEVEGQDTPTVIGPRSLTGPEAVVLPASFGVAPEGGDARRRVSIELTGLRDGDARVTTSAMTGFVEHRKLRLDLFLARRCVLEGPGCEQEGKTCDARGCVDPWSDPDDLPLWSGTLPRVRGQLIDVDFAGNGQQVGRAATGLSEDDVWNLVAGPNSLDYTVNGLVWSTGEPSGVSVRAENLGGTWAIEVPIAIDAPMYQDYVYSWEGETGTLTFSGLPAGQYELWAYAHAGDADSFGNSGFSAAVRDTVGGPVRVETDTLYTTLGGDWNAAEWIEGAQYVVLQPVDLADGQILVLTVWHGDQGTGNAGCLINGLQIVRR